MGGVNSADQYNSYYALIKQVTGPVIVLLAWHWSWRVLAVQIRVSQGAEEDIQLPGEEYVFNLKSARTAMVSVARLYSDLTHGFEQKTSRSKFYQNHLYD